MYRQDKVPEDLLSNRHGKISKVKGKSLLKITIPSETDDDTSTFPKTVFEIPKEKKKKNQSLTGTAKDASNFQENYIWERTVIFGSWEKWSCDSSKKKP